MKKILCVILLVSCILSVCACKGGEDKSEAVVGFAAFESAIKDASSASVVVTVKNITELGALNSKYEVYFNEDNTATVKYFFERFYEIGEGPEGETVKRTEGTIYRDAAGNYSNNAGVDVSAVTAAAAFNIASIKTIANVNDSSDVLTATVPKMSAPAVFGIAFGGNVDFKMVLRDGKLSSMTLISSDKEITYSYSN